MPSHYLNQCWVIVNWTLRRNKFQLNKKETFSFTNRHLKISSMKLRPFCPRGDDSTCTSAPYTNVRTRAVLSPWHLWEFKHAQGCHSSDQPFFHGGKRCHAYSFMSLSSKYTTYSLTSFTVMSNGRHDVSEHRQLHCLFNSLMRLTTKKTSKCRINGPVWGESNGDRLIPLADGQ